MKLLFKYYNIKSKIEDKITRFRFRKINNKIPFYDKKKKIYRLFFDDINRYDEFGCIEYIVSEYINDGLIYEFNINGERTHEHTFSGVLDNILIEYKKGNKVDIIGFENEYSKQEQNVIKKLIKKLELDMNYPDL